MTALLNESSSTPGDGNATSAASATSAIADTNSVPLVTAPVVAAAMAGTAAVTSTASPPAFRRSPREFVAPPVAEVDIQEPPPVPSRPMDSLFEILLPTFLGLLISVGSAFAFTRYLGSNAGTGNGPVVGYLLLTSAPVLSAIFPTVYMYLRQRRVYRAAVADRTEEYSAYLADEEAHLQDLAERQRRANLAPNPPLGGADGCLVRAERRDRRLWERSPRDADFLHVRLGEGSLPPTFSVRTPRQRAQRRMADPLFQAATALAERFTHVDQMAVTLPLRQVGAAGIVGQRAALQDLTRALLLHLATHHSPTEVKLVLTFPEAEREAWEWARWLPHTWSDDRSRRFIAAVPASGSAEEARQLLTERLDVLKQRALQSQATRDDQLPAVVPLYVFVFADPTLLTGTEATALGPLQELLLQEGPTLGVYAVYLADRREAVPQAAGAVVDLRTGAGARLQLIGPPAWSTTFQPDTCDAGTAEGFARVIAPLRVQRLNSTGDLQYIVPLLDVLGVRRLEELDVLTRWRESEPYRSLAAPIGVRAGGEALRLDFHERGHGPHGLQAGATGSGKSELLQSLIASIAVHYHPHEMAFVLIDYKGGGMANAFRNLPHQIGIITNLGGNLTTRALSALRAELQRRQRLFAQVGVTSIDKYLRLQREGKVPSPIPHLAIIADEFAELAQNQPDFMAELISAVRIGRSLGIHLLLATQKPAGVVNDQIWGNTKFRLSLRVERPEDSMEILKRPEAAALRQPGRAYFQVGMNEVFELFQSAYAGAPYNPESTATEDAREVSLVALDGTRRRLTTASPGSSRAGAADSGPTQLDAIVGFLHDQAAAAGIERLPEFWLPPLPATLTLDDLVTREGGDGGGWDGYTWQRVTRWLRPAVGLLDEPARQAQEALRLDLGKDGHLAIFGSPGSGKTSLLHALVVSLARDHAPDEVNLYLLDFGGRTLKLYESLPHVGAVILPDEAERLERLIRYLQDELERRKELLAAAGASNLATYRADPAQSGPKPAALVVLLDNFADFAEAYPDTVEALTRLVREGAGFGLHFVVTATAAASLPFRLAGNFALNVALELNDPTDYGMVVGRTNGLVPAPGTPGRGLVNTTPPVEFQTALPAGGESSIEQTAAVRRLVADMGEAWTGPRATPIRTLPDVVPLAEVLPPSTTWSPDASSADGVAMTLSARDLTPWQLRLDYGPHFVVAGPPAGGKTTTLRTWLLALADRFGPERLTLYVSGLGGPSLTPFGRLPHTAAVVQNEAHLRAVLDSLQRALDERQAALDQERDLTGGILDEEAAASVLDRFPALVVAIDDYDQFQATVPDDAKSMLAGLMRRGRGLGLHVIAAGPVGEFTSGYDPLTKALKDARTGFIVGTTDGDSLGLFDIRLPAAETNKPVPPGRAFFNRRGRFLVVQVATTDAGQPRFREWLTALASRPTSMRATVIPVPPPDTFSDPFALGSNTVSLREPEPLSEPVATTGEATPETPGQEQAEQEEQEASDATLPGSSFA